MANDRRIADCARHIRRRIVLTGGPGAGKTAVLELIRAAECEHVDVLPEAAGIVFGGGSPRDDRTKEERVYLPLLESRMSADAQVQQLKRMERETAPGMPRADEIDIRDIAQHDRHPRVFEEFDRLDAGESLNLVSDHDPRPLSFSSPASTAARTPGTTWSAARCGGSGSLEQCATELPGAAATASARCRSSRELGTFGPFLRGHHNPRVYLEANAPRRG